MSFNLVPSGTKNRIENMFEISATVKRSPREFIRHINRYLKAGASQDDFTISSNITADQLASQWLVYKAKYVMCSKCKGFNTSNNVIKMNHVFRTCYNPDCRAKVKMDPVTYETKNIRYVDETLKPTTRKTFADTLIPFKGEEKNAMQMWDY